MTAINTETKIGGDEASTGKPIINIRPAVKEDCSAMLKLIKELAVYSDARNEVTVEFDHFVESGFGKKPEFWAFVAEVNDKIVGFTLYYIRYSTWKGQRLYLEDLLVTEEWRGNKIGKMLFDRLIKEGKDRDLNGMVWQVQDGNDSAVNFYKKYEGVKFDSGWSNCSLNFKY